MVLIEYRKVAINTLYAKLMEREHLQLQLFNQNNRNDADFDDDEEDDDS